MRQLPLLPLFVLASLSSNAQDEKDPKPKMTDDQTTAAASVNTANDFGWSDKIGFFIGFGMNNAMADIYQKPTIEEAGRTVQIDRAPFFRSNIAFGINYTFGAIHTVRRIIGTVDDAGVEKNVVRYQYYPRGLAAGVFLSPSILSNVSNTPISAPTDLGFALGWRVGPWAFFGTTEVFSLKQPREYFIDKYFEKNQQYVIDGEVQTMISSDNEAIFTDKFYVAYGFKVCFTLGVLGDFNKAVTTIEAK